MKNQTSSLEISHFPVMLNEIIKISCPAKGGIFVDCTFGGGGYSKKLLQFPKTNLISFDRDPFALSVAKKLKDKFHKRFNFFQLKFSQMHQVLNRKVDIIIFDLGLSSFQLNNLKRGFSFNSKETLDMTMGLSDISAQEVVNNLSEKQLKLIIKILGEEKEASKIAKNIVKARALKKIKRVDELVKIIENSKKKKFSNKINPSTKTFQALRIFVNKEITELVNGIISATKFLKPGGKILVVSFHSIEDKIVKYFFKSLSETKSISRYVPKVDQPKTLLSIRQKKPITPSEIELKKNISSRSAKLRFVVKKYDFFDFKTDILEKFKFLLEIENLGDKI